MTYSEWQELFIDHMLACVVEEEVAEFLIENELLLRIAHSMGYSPFDTAQGVVENRRRAKSLTDEQRAILSLPIISN